MPDNKKRSQLSKSVVQYYKNLSKLFNGPVVYRKVANKIKGPGKYGVPVGTARAFLQNVNNSYASALASYGTYCIDGNTEVWVVDLCKAVTIKELSEKYFDKSFYVYSYDLKNKKVVIAEAKFPRKTKTDKTIKLIFDDGSELICTPDHKILMRNGEYKEAQNIELNDSIMPLWDGKTRSEEWKDRRRKEKAPQYRHDLTLEKITQSAIKHNFVQKKIYEELNCLNKTLLRHLRFSGFSSWKEFCCYVKEYNNHKVVKIEESGIRDVYDLEVPGYNNFAIAYNGNPFIYIHNSRLARYSDYCISRHTKIWTIEHGPVEIEKLCEMYPDPKQIFHVYSYDHSKKSVTIDKACNPHMTKVDMTYKVSFDKGGYVIANSSHKFLLRSGEYRALKDLKVGDSLMPLYRAKFRSTRDYVLINTLNRNNTKNGKSWQIEHTFIMEKMLNRVLNNDKDPTCREVVHHKNFKADDNRLKNLEIMIENNHKHYHAVINNKHKWSDPKWRERHSRTHSEFMRNNNPSERKDLTFDIIDSHCKSLVAKGVNLSFPKHVYTYFGTDAESVLRRLRKYGFKTISEYAKSLDNHWRHNGSINDARQNPRYKHDLTFEKICNVYKPSMSMKQLQEELGVSYPPLRARLRENGFSSWNSFVQNYTNHKIASIEPHGEIPVYDLCTLVHHNIAAGNEIIWEEREKGTKMMQGIVFISQSEMESLAEINAALDIYADEITSSNENGEILKIISSNPEIRRSLENLFYDTLNIEYEAWNWVRNMCKYGDQFLLLDHHIDYGILNAFPLPVNEIEREEGYDKDNPLLYRYRWITQGNKVLDKWQIVQFRVNSNDSFMPYGASVLEGARRVWRQLILMEDAVMIYRIVRSPERRVFKIDVGNIAPQDVPAFMEQAKKQLKQNQVVDSNTGRVDLRFNPLSSADDYFIPKRGEHSSEISTLPGGQFTGDVDDLKYIRDKLFAALKIPKSYLGYEEDISAKSTLCIASKTKIPLLDGRTLSLEEIIQEYVDGKTLYSYSVDTNTGRVIHGKIIWAGITQKNVETLRIWFDNDKFLDCTPNHEILLRNGKKVYAEDVRVGDSIMPLYRRKGLRDYEEVYHPGLDIYEFTHKAISLSSENYIQGNVIHHKDFNKNNNAPDNLDCSMKWLEHRRYHQKNATRTLQTQEAQDKRYKDPDSKWNQWIKSDEHKQQSRDFCQKHFRPGNPFYDYVHSEKNSVDTSEKMKEVWQRPEYRQKKIQQNKDRWENEQFKKEHSGENHWISKKYKEYDFEWLIKFCKENNILEKKRFLEIAPIGPRYLDKLLKQNKGRLWRSFRRKYLDGESPLNHKVTKIEVIKDKQDVGCLTIDNEFHNFAIDAGIFVGNSQLDVRFARTVQRLQRIFISELNKIAIIHLYSMGYRDNDLTNFELAMANPSAIAELQRLELIRTKFEVSNMVPQTGMFDKQFVYDHIWQLSPEEVESIIEGRRRDQLLDTEIMQVQAPPLNQLPAPAAPPMAPGVGMSPLPPGGALPPPPAPLGAAPAIPPPMPGEEQLPLQTSAKDPNMQSATPNELVKVSKGKKMKKMFPDLKNHVFNTKKTALDFKRNASELSRLVRAPFGEDSDLSDLLLTEDNDAEPEDKNFVQSSNYIDRITEELENFYKSSLSEKKEDKKSNN